MNLFERLRRKANTNIQRRSNWCRFMGHVETASLQVEAEALAVHEEFSHLEEAECVQRVPRIERDLDGFRWGPVAGPSEKTAVGR